MPKQVQESAESEAADGYADMLEIDEVDASEAVMSEVIVAQAKTALISLEDARGKIGADVLSVLDQKFKGELTEVRHPDTGDLFD